MGTSQQRWSNYVPRADIYGNVSYVVQNTKLEEIGVEKLLLQLKNATKKRFRRKINCSFFYDLEFYSKE